MTSKLALKVQSAKFIDANGVQSRRRRLLVEDASGAFVERFSLMCVAMEDDIESAAGSGAKALAELHRIESGEVDKIEADGNAWVAHITRDKVWFEGLYNQGEGGAVSFAQYKLAVQTYVQFLADPQSRPIEVPFPAD